jgi:hypothetical protein
MASFINQDNNAELAKLKNWQGQNIAMRVACAFSKWTITACG